MINGEGSEMDKFIRNHNLPVHHLSYSNKKDLIKITVKLYRLMKSKPYDIVHAHLFEAALCGLMAASLAGMPRRIITRHHSDYHHTWHPHAVIYDRFINFLATDIVAVSSIVRDILINWEKVNPSKVHLIHHGVDPAMFEDSIELEKRAENLRIKYSIPEGKKIVGAVSRFIEWKGVQYIVPAISNLLKKGFDLHLILANATGNYETEILEALKQLPAGSFTLIKFENDSSALFKLFDYFVHVPVSRESEAFGQVYMEAFFSSKPCIFTLSGIAADIAVDQENCMVVPFADSNAIEDALRFLVLNPAKAEMMAINGLKTVKDNFDVKLKISRLETLYSKS
jgi:glycosyltransferase involved in cell wall biosynthesis